MNNNINWNNFKFIIKYKQIEEIYVDNFYMDIEKLQGTPIWDKYHNLLYWLSKDYKNNYCYEPVIDNDLYEEIRLYFRGFIKTNKKSTEVAI